MRQHRSYSLRRACVIDLAGQRTDPEDDPLTVAKINEEPVEGPTTVSLPTGAILTVDPNGQFTFDPNSQHDSLPPGETATETMEYTVTDGQGGTDVATVTITVSGINDAPDAEDDSESTSPSSPVSSSMFPNDSDPEGDELTVTEVNGVAVDDGATVSLPSGALVTVSTSGQYTYNPNGQFDSLPSNEEGMDTFTYVISDGEGGTDLATVTIVLPGEEDPPMAANDFEETIPGAPLSDNALLNDSDPEDDDLTVIGLGGGEVGVELDLPSGSKVVLQSDGTYDYTPSDSYSDMEHGDTMVDTFEYTISDGTGRTDVATVTIVVHSNNTHPFAEDDSRTTHHDATVTASVLTNDSDPESDKLTVHSVGLDESDPDTAITLPSGAVVTLSAGGTFTYDPNHVFDSLKEDEMGTDTFPYVITDGNGGYATATVTILIPGANDPPVGPNGQFTFDPNSQHDSLPPGETATETMEYTVTDGQGGTDVATVTITIVGAPDVDPQRPSIAGTDSPTIAPEPSVVASDSPSTSPSFTSFAPSQVNAVVGTPSAAPSSVPSLAPKSSLEAPSSMPSATPQPVMTLVGESPSAAPSSMPSAAPEPFVVTLVGESPSAAPSSMPSAAPEPFVVTLVGESPSAAPSSMPSAAPEPSVVTLVGESPSAAPSSMPSAAPEPSVVTLVGEFTSGSPSAVPSAMPSSMPQTTIRALLSSDVMCTKSVSREIERRVGTKTATFWARNRLNLRSTGIEYMYNAKYMYCSS